MYIKQNHFWCEVSPQHNISLLCKDFEPQFEFECFLLFCHRYKHTQPTQAYKTPQVYTNLVQKACICIILSKGWQACSFLFAKMPFYWKGFWVLFIALLWMTLNKKRLEKELKVNVLIEGKLGLAWCCFLMSDTDVNTDKATWSICQYRQPIPLP